MRFSRRRIASAGFGISEVAISWQGARENSELDWSRWNGSDRTDQHRGQGGIREALAQVTEATSKPVAERAAKLRGINRTMVSEDVVAQREAAPLARLLPDREAEIRPPNLGLMFDVTNFRALA